MRSGSFLEKIAPEPTVDNDTVAACQMLRSQSIDDGTCSGEKYIEMEEADTTGFLHYMDEQVHDTWDSAKALMIGAQRLLHIHELPKEWQENEYVLTG